MRCRLLLRKADLCEFRLRQPGQLWEEGELEVEEAKMLADLVFLPFPILLLVQQMEKRVKPLILLWVPVTRKAHRGKNQIGSPHYVVL